MEASLALPLFGELAEPEVVSSTVGPNSVAFVVYGTPAPAGSKRAFVIGGRARITDDSRKSRPWKTLVSQKAGEVMAGRELFRGPLSVSFTFTVRRPKKHFGARGLLPSAQAHPTAKPDVLKLARGVEDALSGLVYFDDAQIVREVLAKEYGEQEGVRVLVVEL